MNGMMTPRQKLMLAGIYVLTIAAACPWPLQNAAHNLLIVFTVVCASVAAILMLNAEEVENNTLEKCKAKKKGYDKASFKTMSKRVSWVYCPLMLICVFAGMWVLALMWVFTWFVIMGLGANVLEKLRKEEEDGVG